MFAARWGDLDREGRKPVLRVRTSKTAGGLRLLPLTPEMARRLTKRRSSATYAGDADPIFPSAV